MQQTITLPFHLKRIQESVPLSILLLILVPAIVSKRLPGRCENLEYTMSMMSNLSNSNTNRRWSATLDNPSINNEDSTITGGGSLCQSDSTLPVLLDGIAGNRSGGGYSSGYCSLSSLITNPPSSAAPFSSADRLLITPPTLSAAHGSLSSDGLCSDQTQETSIAPHNTSNLVDFDSTASSHNDGNFPKERLHVGDGVGVSFPSFSL